MKKIIIYTSLYSALMIIFGVIFEINMSINLTTDISFFNTLINNMKIQGAAVVLSIGTVGIYSLIYLSTNFILLGISFQTVMEKYSIGHAVLYLIPHGIVEVPSMILTGAIGIYIVYSIIRRIFKKKAIAYKKIFKVLLINFALIVVAALIEAFITPLLIRLLIK